MMKLSVLVITILAAPIPSLNSKSNMPSSKPFRGELKLSQVSTRRPTEDRSMERAEHPLEYYDEYATPEEFLGDY